MIRGCSSFADRIVKIEDGAVARGAEEPMVPPELLASNADVNAVNFA